MKSKLLIFTLSLALLLSACGSSTPEAIPTVVLAPANADQREPSPQITGDLIASAMIVPAQEASLAFQTSGNIIAVHISVGDTVKTGDILVELDSDLAQLDVQRAELVLRELKSPGAIARAEEAVANTLETRDDEAHDVEALAYGRASQEMLDEIQAEITLAEKRLEVAQAAYDRVANKSLENAGRANALLALNNARNYLNSLRADYGWYLAPRSDVEVSKTKAQANAAEAAYQEAVWYLAALQGEDLPAEASGLMLSQLQQAETDLAAAQKRLEMTQIKAPFDGIIAEVKVSIGDFATPAQPLVIITNLSNPLVKTTDLSERDILAVQIGAPALISIDALGKEYEGKVVSISPTADTLGGDVVYEVTLVFTEKPEGILGGMTAEIIIGKK